MKTIRIPENPITLVQAAYLLAEAVTPGNPDAARWSLNELLADAHSGAIRGRNPLTLAPVEITGILPADYASLMVLTSEDLRLLAAERHICIKAADAAMMVAPSIARATEVEPVQTAPAPAPLSEARAATNAPQKTMRSSPMREAMPYLKIEHRAGAFSTFNEFILHLIHKSGKQGSPFRATKRGDDYFVLDDSGKPLTHKTIENNMQKIRGND